jgi:hypothetical protein
VEGEIVGSDVDGETVGLDTEGPRLGVLVGREEVGVVDGDQVGEMEGWEVSNTKSSFCLASCTMWLEGAGSRLHVEFSSCPVCK